MLLTKLIVILGYCGNSFAAGSVAAPDTDCSFTCPANVSSRRGFLTISKTPFIGQLLTPRQAFEFCGAGNRLSVYVLKSTVTSSSTSGSVGTTVKTSSTSTSKVSTTTSLAASGFPSGWSYQGCWVDGANGKILTKQQPNQQTTNSGQSCVATCAGLGYTIAGTECMHNLHSTFH